MSTDQKQFDADTFNFPRSTLLNFAWLLLALLAFQGWNSQVLAAEPSPTKQNSEAAPAFETVQQWWNDKHPEPPHDPTKTTDPLERAERIDLNSGDPIVKVQLLDRTTAFLFPVSIDPRGRNDWIHLVLVRPKLRDVQELPSPAGRSAKAYDLDGDGVSEIVVEDLDRARGQLQENAPSSISTGLNR